MKRGQKRTLGRIIGALALFAIGLVLGGDRCGGWLKAGFMLAAWLLAGYDVLWDAIRGILRGQVFDENFLMALATVCAIAMKDWGEAAAVMIFFQIGELFEQIAVERSRKSISSLTELRPDFAVVLRDGKETRVDPEEVSEGDILVVRPGERIAVDGVVVSGEGALDTASVTGESMPADVAPGSAVVSGSVNLSGVLQIRAESAYEHSTVARILTLVENAEEKKSASERLITRFAKYYTPSVIGAAVLLAAIPPIFFGQPFSEWLTRALTFLVISCPCALVISVPLAFFSGMGAAARLGVVVKGGGTMEQLAKLDTVVFDKTGTLTEGEFSVQSIVCFEGTEAGLLRVAALCEGHSNHPLASAVQKACPDPNGTVESVREVAGNGITALIDGRAAAVGNLRLMERLGLVPAPVDAIGTVLYVALDGKCIGAIVVSDTLREGAAETIEQLHNMGVRRTVMLTGDREETARHYAKRLGLAEYRAKLLPQDKVTAVEGLLGSCGKNRTLAFVGDGVNDAPVLTAANAGIAMGGIGSDAAVEAADAVLLNDDLTRIPLLLRISRKTCGIAKQNIAFALAVKAICLVLGALGYAPMWLAIFADVGVAVLAILNSFRALRVRQD